MTTDINFDKDRELFEEELLKDLKKKQELKKRFQFIPLGNDTNVHRFIINKSKHKDALIITDKNDEFYEKEFIPTTCNVTYKNTLFLKVENNSEVIKYIINDMTHLDKFVDVFDTWIENSPLYIVSKRYAIRLDELSYSLTSSIVNPVTSEESSTYRLRLDYTFYSQ